MRKTVLACMAPSGVLGKQTAHKIQGGRRAARSRIPANLVDYLPCLTIKRDAACDLMRECL